VAERQRTGQQVGRNRETAEEFELALAKPGGGGALRFNLNMRVMIHTETSRSSLDAGMRK
jgi:hypothetical protein